MQLKQQEYLTVMDGLRLIAKEEGFSGLYKGVYGKLLQSVLTASFLFYSKEKLYRLALLLLLISGYKINKAVRS
jgi:adenine nucleotide transporter 17